MFSYGSKLKQYRQEHNLRQSDLAEILDMKPSFYCRIEAGNVDLRLTTLIHICKKLHLTATDLIEIGEEEA